MRTLFQRVLVTFMSTTLLAAAGVLGGYLLGRDISMRQAQLRLDQYANRILLEGSASSTESRQVLAAMNASPFPVCSDAEVAYFRQLIFQSQFLKAAGRMQDGAIECSTTSGRSAQVGSHYTPNISRKDGTRVYRNLPPFRVDDQTVISIQLGDSFIVYNPYNLKTLSSLPMHYAVTAVGASSRETGQMIGDVPPVEESVLTTEGKFQVDGSLYSTKCSRDYASCMTAYIAIPDALKMSRGYRTGCLILGGFSGALFGLLFPLLYRRNKSVEQQLLRALRGDALSVVYQPIVDLATGRIVEAEALVRWTDEYKTAISPDVFVKIAEERGFVGAITRLVVRHVLRDFGGTMRARPNFRVNVNIAGRRSCGCFIPADARALPGRFRSVAKEFRNRDYGELHGETASGQGRNSPHAPEGPLRPH